MAETKVVTSEWNEKEVDGSKIYSEGGHDSN